MTIGIDASRALKQNKTGMEWYVYYIIENLLQIDSDNQYILYYKNQPNEWLKKLNERKNVKIKRLRWPFIYFWTQGRLSLEMLLYKFHWIPAFAGMTKKKPDVLFIPASAMPIIHPKNTISTIHDVGFMKYPEAYSEWQRFYLKWSTKFAVKYAKKIITISEFSKQEIIKYFTPSNSPLVRGRINKDKIFVTHLAVEIKNPASSQKNKKINSPYIFFIGRLEKKKNIVGIIEGFALFKQNSKLPHKLVLAGSRGSDWGKAKEVIKKYNLQDAIIELGYIDEKDKPALYQESDLFLFPSLYEGFGLPILEAMAYGVPVITSNSGAMAEVAGDSAILVDPNDYENIADQISEVLENKELQDDLIKKGKERVKEFSWEKCAKETLEILEN
ncbi:MAG: glycosyltransferase family 1 protein [Candidatus Falkowbacteria bacterium]